MKALATIVFGTLIFSQTAFANNAEDYCNNLSFTEIGANYSFDYSDKTAVGNFVQVYGYFNNTASPEILGKSEYMADRDQSKQEQEQNSVYVKNNIILFSGNISLTYVDGQAYDRCTFLSKSLEGFDEHFETDQGFFYVYVPQTTT